MIAMAGSGLDSLKTMVDSGPLFAFPTQPDPRVVQVVGFWRRLAAGTVDALLLLPILIAAGWIGSQVAGMRPEELGKLRVETVLDLFLSGGWAFYGTLALILAVVMSYAVMFLSTSGRTPGLALVGARVINIYGERPELWRVVLRCAGTAVGALLLGLGLLWAGFDREKRGLQDLLAGTYVVRQPKRDQAG